MWSLILLGTGGVGGWVARGNVVAYAQERLPLSVTHIFTDRNGQTRKESIAMPFVASTPPDRGTLESALSLPARQIAIVRTSPDYLSDFHSVTSRRYIIMLSGHREYEVADGQKFSIGPGEIMLVEDLTGRGHLTRGSGDDAVNVIVALDDTK